MRKVTQDAVQAFYKGEKFKRGNTEVRIEPRHTGATLVRFYLHNNCIAEYVYTGNPVHTVDFTMSHWGSVTTRERLSGILACYGYAIGQRNYTQVLLKRGEYVQDIDPAKWYIVSVDGVRVA